MRAAVFCSALLLAAGPGFCQPPGDAHQALAQYPELATAYSLGALFVKPLTFLAVLLVVGLVLGPLTDRAVWPAVHGSGPGYTEDPARARRVAIGRLVVWSIALVAATEAVGLHWFPVVAAPIVGLAGRLLVALTVVAAGFAVALSLGGRGREFALSLLGWYYLTRHPARPGPQTEIDLGGGVTGKLACVDLLHTTFDLGDGRSEVRPNAWLMEAYFHWGAQPPRPSDQPRSPANPQQ